MPFVFLSLDVQEKMKSVTFLDMGKNKWLINNQIELKYLRLRMQGKLKMFQIYNKPKRLCQFLQVVLFGSE